MTSDYLINASNAVAITGIQAGPILAAVLIRTRGGQSIKNSALSTTVILILLDLWNALPFYTSWYLKSYLISVASHLNFSNAMFNSMVFGLFGGNFLFSIFSDLIGGPLAGILCGWIAREIADTMKLPRACRIIISGTLKMCLYISGAGAILIALYLVFIHPRSQHVVLTVRKQHRMHVTYGTHPAIPIPQIWQVPLADIHVNAGINLQVTTTASAPVVVRLAGARGCKSASESAAISNLADSALASLDLNGLILRSTGALANFEVIPSNNGATPAALVSVSNGADVVIEPNSLSPGRSFRFSGEAELQFAASAPTLTEGTAECGAIPASRRFPMNHPFVSVH